MIDINDLERLRERENEFRSVVENSPVGIAMVDKDGHLTFCNRAMARIVGYSPEELRTMNFEAFTHADDLKREWPLIEAMRNGASDEYQLEKRYIHKSGHHVWVDLSAGVARNASGEISFGFAFATDITARRMSEEALRTSEERFRLSFHLSPDAIAINRLSDGRYVDINQGFTDNLGYTRADVMGKTSLSLSIWVDPKDRARLASGLRKAGRVVNMEALFKRKDGTRSTGLMSANVITIDHEPHILSVTRDIGMIKKTQEEKERLKAQLLRSQKLESLGTLAGGIAHDFNNILTSIVGFTELAMEEAGDGTTLHAMLSEVLGAGKRAADLTRQILTFSRQERPRMAPMDITPPIQDALRLLRATLPATLTIKSQISASPMIVEADNASTHQMIVNLATNAAHAMEGMKGVMTVWVEQVHFDENAQGPGPNFAEGDYVRITVSDTGPGIPEDHLEKIFDPYFTSKDADKGTGLGLAVVHGIVKSCGGHIAVRSRLGEGAAFIVHLPAARDPAAEKSAPQFPALSSGAEHILFVDDEPAIVAMQEKSLKRMGYAVTARNGSLEALAAIREAPDAYDLVITDMTMPNMTGDQLAAEIKKVRRDLPVIICTGFSEKMVDGTAVLADVDEFMIKPVDRADMAKTIRRVLDGRKKNSGRDAGTAE